MVVMAGRILIRIGIAMLVLSLLVRPAINDKGSMMGDNLALITCLLVIATGVVGRLVGKRIDGPLADMRSKKAEGDQPKKDH